ncbi:hypothetical protein [Stakelama marina]|uniref:SIMPL domain-containing protein n=1 Tax=Stakelama marina TaxID=2826939 RepID=A0A8T4I8T9_9SPHN|nr:hypothetical protein [Stakelama marina]MBR0550920.1 hypothetical protein [Stakelama marina]
MMRRLLLIGSATIAALPLGGAQASGGGNGTDLAFIPMERISVPIVDAGRVEGALRFRIVLEAKDDEAAQKLTAELPTLRAQALSIGSEFSRLSASPFIAVDARRFSAELNQAMHKREPAIARVLLVEVAARSS